MLYGYGYRRSYTCSFNVGDLSTTPAVFSGIQSIVRKTGASITIYTCTLPQPIAYDYNVFVQIAANRTEATTADNDFSVLVAKAVDRSSFSVAMERASGSNDVSVLAHLVEK